MNFEDALAHAKEGYSVYRQEWADKQTIRKVVMMEKLYLPPFNTQGTHVKVNDRTAKHIGNDIPLDSQRYFAAFNHDNTWQPGWLPTQSDLFAEDWNVVSQ